MNDNINIPDSNITTNLTFRQLVLMNMQQLTNFPYIENDFDALTDYELLCLVVKFLNDVIANQNEQNDSITRMYNSFLALQDYVNNTKDELEDAFNELNDYVRDYFANLDVQEEINNKLDSMLEDGSLEQIIEQFIQSSALWTFDTVSDMKSATNLVNGSYAKTLGYYAKNDGGMSNYKIRTKTESDVIDEILLIEISDTLVAELIIEDEMNPVQFGAKKDNETDSTINLQKACSVCNNILLDGNYLISGNIVLNSNFSLKNGKITISSNNDLTTCFRILDKENINIENVIIESVNDKNPVMPTGHTARSGVLSSNIRGFFITASTNLSFNNITFTNMLYDFNIQSRDVSTFENNNIYITNIISNGGQTGIYAQSITNLYVNTYTFTPNKGAGGFHMLYTALKIGKARFTNMRCNGDKYCDVPFDFADFNEQIDSAYEANIIVDDFYIKANRLCAIKRKCDSITLKNGRFIQCDNSSEAGTDSYGYALALYYENNLFPTINIENVEFIKSGSNNYPSYLLAPFDTNFGKYIIKNCVIDNMQVQPANYPFKEQIEIYDSTIYANTTNVKILYSTVAESESITFTPYGKLYNNIIKTNGDYVFTTALNTSFILQLKNNNIENTGNTSSLIYNRNENSGDIIINGTDYYGTNIDSSRTLATGITNTQILQYNNYVAGTLVQ